MEKPTPTIEWTRDCRQLLIAWISDTALKNHQAGGMGADEMSIAVRKIQRLATESKSELEADRENLTADF